ncbi:MAG: dUTP diphosphatase [Alphaproteobacteria bacterium]|jgi:dUTP pyrophosphatase|nr:dUTP diphosphatase [Alphaproteobacteria bacterium]MBT5828366.1 dUTP diphosphatase [Alphaproteobacteria bacterium]
MKLQVKPLTNDISSDNLFYATKGSAGIDLRANNQKAETIKPGETKLIPTGIAIALPQGYEAQVRPRSGLALKHSITVLNTPGTIDSDYRGEIGIILINHGKTDYIVENGTRIAQMVIAKYEQVELEFVQTLSDTQRGEGGFGSTGLKTS